MIKLADTDSIKKVISQMSLEEKVTALIGKTWFAEPGKYTIHIGTSSRDIAAVLDFELIGYNPMGFNENTKIVQLAATPGALEELMKFCPDNLISKEEIETSILFFESSPLKDFWHGQVEPVL